MIAGDNLFEFSLADYVASGAAKGDGERDRRSRRRLTRAREPVRSRRARRRRPVVDFVEKPAEPRTTLVATATYLFHRHHVHAARRSTSTPGNSPDQPGRFVEWLYRREPVYGCRFDGDWLDIGDHEQLLRPTTGSALTAGCRRAPPTRRSSERAARRGASVTDISRRRDGHVTRSGVPWHGVARRPDLSGALRELWRLCEAALRRVSRLAAVLDCDRSAAAAALRRPGPSNAVSTAPDGDSRSRPRVRSRPTAGRPATLVRAGRSTGSAVPQHSSPT